MVLPVSGDSIIINQKNVLNINLFYIYYDKVIPIFLFVFIG